MHTKLLAALIATCFAAPALAQSNVTVYGIVDAGLMTTSNGEGTKTKLVSGIADGSRFGFKGVENIGGGYQAIFNLEGRVELDTGSNKAGNVSGNQGYALTKGMDFPTFGSPTLAAAAAATLANVRGPNGLQPLQNINAVSPAVLAQGGGPDGGIFDRMALVGLVTPAGAIMMGRMYTPAYEVFAGADTFESGTAGGWGNITGGTGGLLTAGIAIRSNKAIQYRIKTDSGIGAALMYGFKNSGYVGLDKNFWALNLTYKANGFDVGAGYNRGSNQDGSTGLVTANLGGSYTLDNMKFFAGYQDMRNENAILLPVFNSVWDGTITPSLSAAGVPAPVLAAWTSVFKSTLAKNFKLDAASFSLGMHYRIGSGRIMGSVSRQNDRTASHSNVTQYALGYDYNLSKRTDIYSVIAYLKNENDAQYAPGVASASGGFTSAAGVPGKALQLGIRHKF